MTPPLAPHGYLLRTFIARIDVDPRGLADQDLGSSGSAWRGPAPPAIKSYAAPATSRLESRRISITLTAVSITNENGHPPAGSSLSSTWSTMSWHRRHHHPRPRTSKDRHHMTILVVGVKVHTVITTSSNTGQNSFVLVGFVLARCLFDSTATSVTSILAHRISTSPLKLLQLPFSLPCSSRDLATQCQQQRTRTPTLQPRRLTAPTLRKHQQVARECDGIPPGLRTLPCHVCQRLDGRLGACQNARKGPINPPNRQGKS